MGAATDLLDFVDPELGRGLTRLDAHLPQRGSISGAREHRT